MSPEKAAKEQESRRDHQRNLTAQKEADIKEYTDPFNSNSVVRGVNMAEICHPSHFKNSQQCPLKYPCDSASGSASTTFGPNFAGW